MVTSYSCILSNSNVEYLTNRCRKSVPYQENRPGPMQYGDLQLIYQISRVWRDIFGSQGYRAHGLVPMIDTRPTRAATCSLLWY